MSQYKYKVIINDPTKGMGQKALLWFEEHIGVETNCKFAFAGQYFFERNEEGVLVKNDDKFLNNQECEENIQYELGILKEMAPEYVDHLYISNFYLITGPGFRCYSIAYRNFEETMAWTNALIAVFEDETIAVQFKLTLL